MSTVTTSSIPSEIQAQFDRLHRKVESLASQIKLNREVPKKEWYRPTEVCQLLGISRSKFEAYKRSGFLPIKKIGGGIYIASSDIESLFKNKSN